MAVLKRQLLATPSPLLGDASELAEVWHLKAKLSFGVSELGMLDGGMATFELFRLFTSKGQLPSGVPWAAFGVDRSSVGGPLRCRTSKNFLFFLARSLRSELSLLLQSRNMLSVTVALPSSLIPMPDSLFRVRSMISSLSASIRFGVLCTADFMRFECDSPLAAWRIGSRTVISCRSFIGPLWATFA